MSCNLPAKPGLARAAVASRESALSELLSRSERDAGNAGEGAHDAAR